MLKLYLEHYGCKVDKGLFTQCILAFYFVNVQYNVIKILMSVFSSNITELFQAVWNFYLHATLFLFRSDALLLIRLRTGFLDDVNLKTDVFPSTFQQLHFYTFHRLYFSSTSVRLFLYAPYLSHLHTHTAL